MHYNNYYHHAPHHLNLNRELPHHHHHSHHSTSTSSAAAALRSPTTPTIHQSRHSRYGGDLDDIDERIFEYNNYNTNYNLARTSHFSPSPSPVRDLPYVVRKNEGVRKFIDHDLEDRKYVDNQFDCPSSSEDILKIKWLDNSPRMSKLRESRNKRLNTRLEQFELWDAEQAQKQKQFELAREQRYRNIQERLKTQDFCLDLMRRRHESDIETSRELEVYEDEHYYVDPLDNSKPKQKGPISQFRQFQAEMDDKLKTLQDEIDEVNPRCQIEQTILPRLERTRENYSLQPDVYTIKGKRVLKRPQLGERSHLDDLENADHHTNGHAHHGYDEDGKCVKFYYPYAFNDDDFRSEKLKEELERETERNSRRTQQQPQQLKPIIHSNNNVDESLSKLKLSSSTTTNNNTNEKKVYFEDDVKTNNNKNNNSEKVAAAAVADVAAAATSSNNESVDDELASEMIVKNTEVQKETEDIEKVINEIASTSNDQ